jgi:hypothetical protein
VNLLLLTSHAIAEYDDLRMLTDLGYSVFSIGGAYDEVPFEGKRPALDVRTYPDLQAACAYQRAHQEATVGAPGPVIDWAKGWLHEDVIDWADVIIVHHFPETWIGGQWERIKHKRVIWRTCGQSDPRLELEMSRYHNDGMQIVRYSPNEQKAFEPIHVYAGEDALIRFGKYPSDYISDDPNHVAPFWIGDWPVIGNITQDMKQRGNACGYDRWLADTGQMLTKPAGPGSEALQGGMGPLSYDDMLTYLRRIRVYLYLGTQPASYTLGLMEAMLSGVPVVTDRWQVPNRDWMWLDRLWEAGEIVGDDKVGIPKSSALLNYLMYPEVARYESQHIRARAIELFDVATVGAQWKAFLG